MAKLRGLSFLMLRARRILVAAVVWPRYLFTSDPLGWALHETWRCKCGKEHKIYVYWHMGRGVTRAVQQMSELRYRILKGKDDEIDAVFWGSDPIMNLLKGLGTHSPVAEPMYALVRIEESKASAEMHHEFTERRKEWTKELGGRLKEVGGMFALSLPKERLEREQENAAVRRSGLPRDMLRRIEETLGKRDGGGGSNKLN